MKLPALQEARLIRRYKRFLADVELPSGELLTVHCPNTGSMKRCAETGWRVWISDSANPKRKYRYSWELVEVDGQSLCSVNTQRANTIVGEWLREGLLAPFTGYSEILPERSHPCGSRFDFCLRENGLPDFYVEVKSATLLEKGAVGAFPDAVTTRGQKHLLHLAERVQQGERAALLYLVPHQGINQLRVAAEIDPVYAAALSAAQQAGVEIYAYRAALSLEEIGLDCEIPFVSEGGGKIDPELPIHNLER